MRKIIFFSGILISTTTVFAEGKKPDLRCGLLFGKTSFGPVSTILPLPKSQNIDALMSNVASVAASAYGEDAELIRAALEKELNDQGIKIQDISNIEYNGALESFPTQHRFVVTLTSGLNKELRAVARAPQASSPNVTTLPLPQAQNIDAIIGGVASIASSAYGEDLTLLRAALEKELNDQGIKLQDINNISYKGALESFPPQHRFVVTLTSGLNKELRAVARAPQASSPNVTTLPLPQAQNINALISSLTSVAASAYGEDAKLMKAALEKGLNDQGIKLQDINNISYKGALESFPPQHVFNVTLTSGLNKEFGVIARAIAQGLPAQTEALINRVANQAVSRHGKNFESFKARILQILNQNSINPADIENIEFWKTPNKEEFTITLKGGLKRFFKFR